MRFIFRGSYVQQLTRSVLKIVPIWLCFLQLAQAQSGQYLISSNDLLATFYQAPTLAQETQLRSVAGTQVNQITPQSYRVLITDQVNALTIGSTLHNLSTSGLFHLEYNRPVEVSLQVTDPQATWNTVVPTGLGTHAASPLGGNLNATTALDLTLGAGVPIAVVDINRDYNAALNPDMPTPAINVVANLTSSTVPPSSYHADQVASVIFSATNNGIGKAGVCPGCIWHSYTAYTDIDPQSASTQPLLNELLGFLEQVRTSTAQVVSMSWGSMDNSFAIDTAARALFDSGKILVAATGNIGAPQPLVPARLPYVVSVGSVAADPITGELTWAHTNQGVDLVAPGVGIPSPIAVPGFGIFYEGRSGSSYATPHVAGIFGLLLSLVATQPTNYPVTAALSPTERRDYIIDLVQRTALDLGAPGVDPLFGHGLVQAYEAMRTMQADNRDSIATDLQQGVTEWRAVTPANPEPGAPFLPMFRQSLQQSTPTTFIAINHSARHGECYIPGSYRFNSPNLKVQMRNTDVTIVSASNNNLRVRAVADIDFSLRQSIDTAPLLPLLCISGWSGHSFGLTWKGKQSNQRVAILDYRLGATGYERVATQASGPLPQRSFEYSFPSITGFGNISSHYRDFLSSIEPALTVVENALNAELIGMADAVIAGTLTVDRQHIASYTRVRTSEPSSPEPVLLPTLTSVENNATFTHQPVAVESVSQFGVRVSRSNYAAGIVPGPALPTGSTAPIVPSDSASAVATSANFLNATMQNLYARGLFTDTFNPGLTLTVATGTLDSLAELTIGASARATQPPRSSFYTTAIGQQIGEITGLFDLSLTIHDSLGALLYQGVVPVQFVVPFTNYDVYRPSGEEFELSDRVSHYEQRVTLDFRNSHAVLGAGFLDPAAPLAPGVPVRVGEIGTFFQQTMGPVVVRTLESLSSWETSGDKNLGVYGCIFDLTAMLQRYALTLDGVAPIVVRDSTDCFNLNFKKWLPVQAPDHQKIQDYSHREINYILTRGITEPRARFSGAPIVDLSTHPATLGTANPLRVHFVRSRTTGDQGAEVHSSLNGIASTNLSGDMLEELVFYSELWQAPFFPSGLWVPKRIDHPGLTYETVTRPRDGTYLAKGDHCLPLFKLRFSYQPMVPPFTAQRYAQSFLEHSVFASKDSWVEMTPGACGEETPALAMDAVSVVD